MPGYISDPGVAHHHNARRPMHSIVTELEPAILIVHISSSEREGGVRIGT